MERKYTETDKELIILSDSSEQAEGFLEDIKTELEENANIIMDFGSLKGDTGMEESEVQ